MNARDYMYARLGNSCQTSADTLISNTKFLPMNSDIYTVFPTKMMVYPGPHDSIPVGYGQSPKPIGTIDDDVKADVDNPDERREKYEGYKFALPKGGCGSCRKFD